MYRCIICRFDVPQDDVALRPQGTDGRCVCLSCYGCETETWAAMPKPLRRELIAIMAEL